MQELPQSKKPVRCHGYITGHQGVLTESLKSRMDYKFDVEVEYEEFMNPARSNLIMSKGVHGGTTFFFHRDHLHIVGVVPEELRRDCIVVDIDGVLTYYNRQQAGTVLQDGSVVQWTDIIKSVDAKVSYVVDMLQAFSGSKLIFLTARGESQRIVTEAFLDKHFKRNYTLFMRGFNDNSTNCGSLKVQMLQTCIEPYYNVKMFLEDTEETIKLCNKVLPHIPTLLIRNGS